MANVINASGLHGKIATEVDRIRFLTTTSIDVGNTSLMLALLAHWNLLLKVKTLKRSNLSCVDDSVLMSSDNRFLIAVSN